MYYKKENNELVSPCCGSDYQEETEETTQQEVYMCSYCYEDFYDPTTYVEYRAGQEDDRADNERKERKLNI